MELEIKNSYIEGEEELKRCNECGDNKSIDEFHNDISMKDGKCGSCKNCRNKRARERKKKEKYWNFLIESLNKFIKDNNIKPNILPGIKIRKVKECIKCKKIKTFDQFSIRDDSKDGFRNECKPCIKLQNSERVKTFDGFFEALLGNMKNNAKLRSGVCDITTDDLKELWYKQEGRCYYSGISMNHMPNSDWKCSPDRPDPSNKNYTKDNLVLTCLEFNNATQWSLDKIKTLINLVQIKYDTNEIAGDLRNRLKSKDIKKKLRSLFNSARERSKGNSDRLDEFNLTFKEFLEILLNQRGLCAYSGIKLNYGSYLEENWTASIERINPLKNYTKDNVCLVCYEFNSTDYSIKVKYSNGGSGSWNRDKFNFFIKSLEIKYKIQIIIPQLDNIDNNLGLTEEEYDKISGKGNPDSIKCECGGWYKMDRINNHLKTDMHVKFLTNIEENYKSPLERYLLGLANGTIGIPKQIFYTCVRLQGLWFHDKTLYKVFQDWCNNYKVRRAYNINTFKKELDGLGFPYKRVELQSVRGMGHQWIYPMPDIDSI